MPSTSLKPFEDFLVETLREWLKAQLAKGHKCRRYQFRSPNHEYSMALHQALVRQCRDVLYDGVIELPCFIEAGVRFIPVLCGGATKVGFTENYISRLRDKVASRSGNFNETALIVIHDSLLDTLVNSADDLSESGAVWHPSALENRLISLLAGGKVSRLLLEQRLEQIVADGDTVFGLKRLYEALDDGQLEFAELDLMNDPLLLEMEDSPSQIRKRLDKNKELYDRITFLLETYPDQKEERLKQENFSESFIRKHFKDEDWKRKLDLETCLKEQSRNKKERVKLDDIVGSKNLKVIRRPKNRKAAGERDQALLLVQDDDQQKSNLLTITFDGDPVKQQEVLVESGDQIAIESQVKTRAGISTVSLSFPPVLEPSFFQVKIKRDKQSETYLFQCLAVPDGFLHVDSIKNIFRVDFSARRLILQTDENSIRVNPTGDNRFPVTGSDEIVPCEHYDVVDFEEASHQSDLVLFVLRRGECSVSTQVEACESRDSVLLPYLFNVPPLSIGIEQSMDAEIDPERAKLIAGNSEDALIATRLEILRFEHKLISEQTIAVLREKRTGIEELCRADLELGSYYQQLFNYFAENSTLPSLVGWNKHYTHLVTKLLARYIRVLESVEQDKPLTEAQKLIVQIGFVRDCDRELIAPFSPLTLAYYLELSRHGRGDLSFGELPSVTLSRLNPAGLVPYLYSPDAPQNYAHVEPLKQNPAWLEAVSKTNTGLSFVRNLVRDKIKEFLKAYDALFTDRRRGTLKINCVNLGRADEFLKGLLDYYDEKREDALNIHVYFYDEQLVINALDDFADASSGQEIRSSLGIERHKNADILVHLLRTRVTYSKFRTNSEQSYAHIAFFCNITPVSFDPCTMTSAISGILADGLLSGPAAERDGEPEQAAYFSGFGLRNVDTSNTLLTIASYLNSLLQPARRTLATPFFEGQGHRLTVNTAFRKALRSTYENAIWTVLIDPKVNLDFFRTEQDVVLIHFSDQYTSSAEYDAITVTQERDLFSDIAGDNLKLSELNAFNGVWLLDMLKASEKTKKERRGIIAAYKFLFSLLVHDDITWVPLAVAEMIRVTGNLGLKMQDSDFSRNVQGYKSGAISDDVLFAGFFKDKMVLLPLEVKTGAVPDYTHASEQARELARYLGDEILGPRTLKGRLYRSLFMRQVFMQVEKYELYDVFSSSQLRHLNETREYWLTGEFEVCHLSEYARGAVVALVESQAAYQPRFKKENDVLFAELPYALLTNLIKAELKDDPARISAPSNPPEFSLLRNYRPNLDSYGTKEPNDVEESDSEPEDDQVEARESFEEYADMPTDQLEADQPLASGLHALLGHNVLGDVPLIWEPTNTAKFMNPNSGIIGTMGTGKTQFTKSLVTQLVRNQHLNVGGKAPGILIFDYKSDYVDEEFLAATNAQKFMPYKLPYNPLSIHGSMPMLPVHTAGGFVETMGRAYRLGPKQKLRLRDIILDAYEACGISRSDSLTWSVPAPTVERIWKMLDMEEKVEHDSLYAALRELSDYQIFENDPKKLQSLYDLIAGVTVIELAGFSPDLQNLIVGLTLDQFYAQMQKSGKPVLEDDHRQLNKLILVDEADNFMSQDFPALRKILKEGREYGVGVILSTQDIKHFKTSENDYTAYILTWVVHRVAQIQMKDIKSIFNIDDRVAQDRLMEDVRQLEKHYSIYIDGEKNLVKMRDRAFWELFGRA